MAVVPQRDPAATAAALTDWLAVRLDGADRVRVSEPRAPGGQGFSTETMVFDASWSRDGAAWRRRLVARLDVDERRVLPDQRLATQARVLAVLRADGAVPVPEVVGHEPGSAALGGPFMVTEWLDGRAPLDLPSYHRQGWVAELAEAERAQLWFGALDVLARIHRVDVERRGLSFVADHPAGSADLRTQLEFWAGLLDSFGARSPVLTTAERWLANHRPTSAPPPGLLWGDARLGNLLFRDLTPVAVLDWEMVALGPAEVDLAWFLYLDWHLSEGIGASRLAGLPTRADTVAYYEQRLGRRLRDLRYYEVFAGLRFAVITSRVTALAVAAGLVPPDFPLHRNAVRLLSRSLGLPSEAERSS